MRYVPLMNAFGVVGLGAHSCHLIQPDDPGILIDIYTTLTTYEIPGLTPFVC
jgi:hypothetical protein